MRESLLKYTRDNIVYIIAGIVLRQISISTHLSKYSYYDIEEAVEYFSGNYLAERPSLFTWLVYKTLSLVLSNNKIYPAVDKIVMISDLLCSYLLNSNKYFLITSILPSDTISIICLLFTLHHRRIFHQMITYILLIICTESTHTKCEPGVNVYWYINMQMFSEYTVLFHKIFRITHFHLLVLSLLSDETSTKLYMAMVFKEFGYRGYVLIWFILQNTSRSIKVHNLCRGLTVLGGILDLIVWYMLVFGGVGNMNFLCWSNIITILSTGTAVILHEYFLKHNQKYYPNRKIKNNSKST